MIKDISETTKKRIFNAIYNMVEETIYDSGLSLSSEPFDEIPSKFFKNAVDCLKSNFETIEEDYQFLQEYYDDNNEVPNLKELKPICCRYAESLI